MNSNILFNLLSIYVNMYCYKVCFIIYFFKILFAPMNREKKECHTARLFFSFSRMNNLCFPVYLDHMLHTLFSLWSSIDDDNIIWEKEKRKRYSQRMCYDSLVAEKITRFSKITKKNIFFLVAVKTWQKRKRWTKGLLIKY